MLKQGPEIRGRRRVLTGTLPNVPRWARISAHLVPIVTLPSGLWRIALVAGLPVDNNGPLLWWEPVYITSLTLVSEGIALLTLGLIQPWGETVPRWIPLLGGQRVAPLAAVVPALLGAAALIAITTYGGLVAIFGSNPSMGSSAKDWLLAVCYAPLLAWGPLVAAVAISYYRRRRAQA
ncbi:hypothetical protein [Streptomyces sp. NBC_00572]|uniref:hypothetical protein n=1 Tax=Streptomyces sp. NBC_00572 TaxID=2903664 RepID=UPI002254826D|nr:hypothetical protein [Streptomyces sp. NBC_00572]MCX4985979.1 hypothetical protein [Streptomyces sp. NBC_00572]